LGGCYFFKLLITEDDNRPGVGVEEGIEADRPKCKIFKIMQFGTCKLASPDI
jgi:hypothetical protein